MKKLQFWTSIAIILLSCCLAIFGTDGKKTNSQVNSPAYTAPSNTVNNVSYQTPTK